MSYPIVTSVPEGSEWLGDGTMFIPEGCVKAWGHQAPYGRYSVISNYRTPTGKHVIYEKYELDDRITEADARESLKSAGY